MARRRRKIKATAKDLPKDLLIQTTGSATIVAAAEGGENTGPPTFTFDPLSSGGKLLLNGWSYPVVADVKGIRASATIKVNLEHDRSKRVGQGTAVIQGGKVTMTGKITATGDAAQEVLNDHAQGHEFQSSIVLLPDRGSVEFIPAGKPLTANGRRFVGPVYYVKTSEFREAAFVDIGGDAEARAKIAATLAAQERSMDPKFKAWLEKQGFVADELTDGQLKPLEAAFKAETAPPADPPAKTAPPADPEGDPVPPAVRAAYLSEQAEAATFAADVRKICAAAGHPTIKVDGKEVLIEAAALQGDWTLEKVELEVLKATRQAAPAVHAHAGPNLQSDTEQLAVEAALIRQSGLPSSKERKGTGERFGYEHWYSDEVLEASHRREYRQLSLHQLMDMNIRAAGQDFYGGRKSDDYIQAFLRAEQSLRIEASGFSTLAVSNILENLANKQLLAAYESQETVWEFFCAVRSASDFKVHNYYRLHVDGGYEVVGSDGQIKHGRFADDKYTVTPVTRAQMLALTRQDMINDDLDAFNQIPGALGRHAAIAIEEEFFVVLLGNAGSFFAVGNNNLLTGAGSDLTLAGLGASEENFYNQVDNSGSPLMVSPDRILTGTQDFTVANDLFQDTQLMMQSSTTSADVRTTTRNPHQGKFRPFRSPYINNTNVTKRNGTAITGQDSNQWYMSADPNVLAAFNIAFLNGNRAPTIDSAETDFNTLGMQFRGYHDWGIGQADPKGMTKNAGA
jgi:hypothetical protein